MTTHGGLTDDGIGRILVASLHHGIGDAMPMRLEYYEHWLGPMGLRDNRAGLAPLGAVLSFLRLEGQAVYDDVMTRAGRSSAEWHVIDDRFAMRMAKALPRGWRRRYALGRTRRLVRAAFDPAHARVSARRGHARVDIEDSVFCALREPSPWPTCTYFSAAIQRYVELCGAPARVAIGGCRGTGAAACRLDVDFTAAPATGASV
jgi:hypothetical protein